ncbi:hypothetical protein Tco_0918473 [Tanacetum coccineum]
MAATIQFGVKGLILAAQGEAFKDENVIAEGLNVTEYKKEIAIYVSKCLICAKVKAEHQRPSGMDDYVKVLANDAKSIGNMFRYEYGLSSSDGWTKRAYYTNVRGYAKSALYGRKCRSPVLWAEIGDSGLIGPELVQETTDKVVVIEIGLKLLEIVRKELKTQISRRNPLRPFEILERIGPVAYRLRLPKELSSVHDTFHVSNLKKCLADANLHVPLDEIKVDKTLCFVEEPLDIMDRDVKTLKRSKIPIVKVRWNSERGPEFTWEREDHMKTKYPQLFKNAIVETTG